MAKKQGVSGLNIIDVDSRIGGNTGGRVNYMQEAMKVFDIIKEKEKKKIEYNNELKENQRSKFMNSADAINTRLSTYDKGGREAGLHSSIYDVTYDYVEQLKEEFEKYNTVGSADNPENKKKRMEIMGRLQQIQQSSQNFRKDLLTIGKLFGEELDITQFHKGIPTLDLAIGAEILNMDGDYSNVQTVWEADTNSMVLQVTITEDMYNMLSEEDKKKHRPGDKVTWNAQDLISKFPGKDNVNKMIVDIDAFHAQNNENAKKARLGDEFESNVYINDITQTIGGDKMSAGHIFQSTDSHTKWDTWSTDQLDGFSGKYDKGSWAHALEINPDLLAEFTFAPKDGEAGYEAAKKLIELGIIKEKDLLELFQNTDKDDLPGMGMVGLGDDFNVDGILSKDEFDFIMNSNLKGQVIDALVNPQNEAYNHKLSVEEYSKWRASSAQMDWNNEQAILQEKEDEKNRTNWRSKTKIIGGQQINMVTYQSEVLPFVNFIKNPRDGQVMSDPLDRKRTYVYKDGKFYTKDAAGNYSVEVTQFQMAEGKYEKEIPGLKAPETGGTVVTEENKEKVDW